MIIASWSMRSPEAGAVWVERDTYILMFSYCWHGEKVKTVCLPDFPRYRRNKYDDKDLCGVLHRLLDEADLVCGHNSDSFDLKRINGRLITHGYAPPSPYRTVDTLKIARRVFKFDSAKLDNIGRYLDIGRKIPNTGGPLWRGCCEGDELAWETMRRYCKQDTALLVKAYERLKAWAPNHPDMRLYGAKGQCPTCDSNNVQRRGVSVKLKSKYQRLQCRECGHWFAGDKIVEA